MIRAYGRTAREGEWQRDFATPEAAAAWAEAHGATVSGSEPLATALAREAARDHKAEAEADRRDAERRFNYQRGRPMNWKLGD